MKFHSDWSRQQEKREVKNFTKRFIIGDTRPIELLIHSALLSNSRRRSSWSADQADEVLADELDKYRTDMGLQGSRQAKVSDKIITDLPFCSGIEISSALQTRIVEASTSNWWFWFGLLQDYCNREKSALVPKELVTFSGIEIITDRLFKYP